MQHLLFPHDHSLQYLTGLPVLNFPNRTGWGAFTGVWPHPIGKVVVGSNPAREWSRAQFLHGAPERRAVRTLGSGAEVAGSNPA